MISVGFRTTTRSGGRWQSCWQPRPEHGGHLSVSVLCSHGWRTLPTPARTLSARPPDRWRSGYLLTHQASEHNLSSRCGAFTERLSPRVLSRRTRRVESTAIVPSPAWSTGFRTTKFVTCSRSRSRVPVIRRGIWPLVGMSYCFCCSFGGSGRLTHFRDSPGDMLRRARCVWMSPRRRLGAWPVPLMSSERSSATMA